MALKLHGLMPILATPFDSTGALDRAGLRRLVEFELASGVDGVAVFGMASEGFALTTEERRMILDDVVEVVDGHVPVIAGVNGTSTATSIEQALLAQDGGADALMVLPPFMVKPPAASLIDFYGDVADATSLSVMVQDAPGVTGVAMTPALIAELALLDGVDSVKVESPPTAPKVGAVVDAITDPAFAVLGGQNAQFCLEEYARGAVGTMPACEFPDLLGPVLADFVAGRVDDARAAFRRMLPLVLIGLQGGIAWAVHKEILVARGIIEHATVRYPAAGLDAGSRAAVHVVLDELALPPLPVAVRV
ncbi:dihydrodipicolinate synthase family protein [Microbacterium saperdae]|uniref:4-hydroxy-tetrahydrodipicolinate synthase n=1 Tax=Microbacterium saperdae TaxID=69368 RepID=A0A543BKE7_9MICO|nr:dihydrodipicolinate synthase family protein [Microbacterium saperdae]TQL85309.1 4-hydroxy-tetrahydrodipicolinate synthase [Microbacterium saperdae]GGM55316.1 dihydrodipicolinate synthase family protein [Microbacterium saperdae]